MKQSEGMRKMGPCIRECHPRRAACGEGGGRGRGADAAYNPTSSL